jgi:NagD protein
MPTCPIEACIFDLDGTVYLGDTIIPGAVTAIAALQQAGIPVRYFSNNPTKNPLAYHAKLTNLGFTVSVDHILTSALVMRDWLLNQPNNPIVYPIAEPALWELLRDAGIHTSTNPNDIDYVLASFDRTFDYPKLQIAFDAMRAGATLIATNPDKYCPVPGGGQPDCAALIAAIEACTDTRLAFTAGKPSALAAQTAAARVGVPIERCVMIGDRLETDITMGAAGMQTALVMTGATTPEVLATWDGHRPDAVYPSVVECVAAVLAQAGH